MSSRSNGVTKVASSLWPIAWLISSPRCSASRISPARRSISSQERSIASSRRAAAEDVRGVLDEQVEEALLARDQSQSHAARVAGRPGGSAGRERRRYAMLGTWTASVILFIVLQAVLLAIAIGVAIAPRPRRSTTSARRPSARATGDDLGGRVRRLIEEADAATLRARWRAARPQLPHRAHRDRHRAARRRPSDRAGQRGRARVPRPPGGLAPRPDPDRRLPRRPDRGHRRERPRDRIGVRRGPAATGRRGARRSRAAVAGQRPVAGPRGRLRAAPAPADPRRVHREPLARAADAAHDREPARGDADPRGRCGR